MPCYVDIDSSRYVLLTCFSIVVVEGLILPVALGFILALHDSKLLFDVKNQSELKSKLEVAMHMDCSDEIERNQARLRDFDICNTLELVKTIYMNSLKRSDDPR